MPEQWFQVTLESDMVLTADAATAGGHQGLDYLPGSIFLGAAVAAGKAAKFDPTLFLSGRVRFGDGLPAVGAEVAWPMPLSFHKEKIGEWKGKVPLNLLHPAARTANSQPKQWRNDYVTATGKVVQIKTGHRMKAAIDRQQRRCAEGQLFGYQSIPAGTCYLTRIAADDAADLERVVGFLTASPVRLGRSRSAEYGQATMKAVASPVGAPPGQTEDGMVVLYLASDLASESDGLPILEPDATALGLPAGTALVPERCFLRTRRYSPWNAFFNCRLTERQVLCKGSVLVFRLPSGQTCDPATLQAGLANGVGLYREEGLGHVLVNPPWLLQAPCLIEAKTKADAAPTTAAKPPDSPLLKYLRCKQELHEVSVEAFNAGQAWAKDFLNLAEKIKKESGAAPTKTQWSNIREIAVRCQGQPEELPAELNKFCGRGLRRRAWKDAMARINGKDECLLDAMLAKLGNQPDAKACLTLYHAALAVGRELANKGDRR